MTVLIKILQLLLSLSILVIVHEFGHFLVARLFKTRVEKFYLFFDWPWAIFKKKHGETEYGIGMIPLGGYVKISGMIDESMDREQMKLPPQPYEFRSKKSWQRLFIMLGGVFFNFIRKDGNNRCFFLQPCFYQYCFAWQAGYRREQYVHGLFKISNGSGEPPNSEWNCRRNVGWVVQVSFLIPVCMFLLL